LHGSPYATSRAVLKSKQSPLIIPDEKGRLGCLAEPIFLRPPTDGEDAAEDGLVRRQESLVVRLQTLPALPGADPSKPLLLVWRPLTRGFIVLLEVLQFLNDLALSHLAPAVACRCNRHLLASGIACSQYRGIVCHRGGPAGQHRSVSGR